MIVDRILGFEFFLSCQYLISIISHIGKYLNTYTVRSIRYIISTLDCYSIGIWVGLGLEPQAWQFTYLTLSAQQN